MEHIICVRNTGPVGMLARAKEALASTLNDFQEYEEGGKDFCCPPEESGVKLIRDRTRIIGRLWKLPCSFAGAEIRLFVYFGRTEYEYEESSGRIVFDVSHRPEVQHVVSWMTGQD